MFYLFMILLFYLLLRLFYLFLLVFALEGYTSSRCRRMQPVPWGVFATAARHAKSAIKNITETEIQQQQQPVVPFAGPQRGPTYLTVSSIYQ